MSPDPAAVSFGVSGVNATAISTRSYPAMIPRVPRSTAVRRQAARTGIIRLAITEASRNPEAAAMYGAFIARRTQLMAAGCGLHRG